MTLGWVRTGTDPLQVLHRFWTLFLSLFKSIFIHACFHPHLKRRARPRLQLVESARGPELVAFRTPLRLGPVRNPEAFWTMPGPEPGLTSAKCPGTVTEASRERRAGHEAPRGHAAFGRV